LALGATQGVRLRFVRRELVFSKHVYRLAFRFKLIAGVGHLDSVGSLKMWNRRRRCRAGRAHTHTAGAAADRQHGTRACACACAMHSHERAHTHATLSLRCFRSLLCCWYTHTHKHCISCLLHMSLTHTLGRAELSLSLPESRGNVAHTHGHGMGETEIINPTLRSLRFPSTQLALGNGIIPWG